MIIIILIVTLSAKLLPLHLRKENCGVHPYFSVGKRRSLSSNHLTIATHQLCKACCIHEQLFKEIPIEIERIELDRNPSFIEKYNVKRFPYLRFQNHTYNDILNLNQILKFLQPYKLVGISSLLELERFLFSQQEMQDTKIIGIFHGIGEYKSEIKWFTEWCMKNYNYRYQFGMITNSKEVKKIQEKYKNYNQILISRFAGDLEFVEHIEQPPILLIDELKFENSRRYLNTGKPILLIVLDSIVLYEDSFEYLVEFQKLASKFNNQIYVTWMDGNLNEDRLQMLGIEVFQQIPIITFFEIDSSYKIIYDGNIFNQTEISQFIEDYLRYPRDVMFQRYKRIQNTLLDNTLIIRSDNKTLIQQIKWNVKKFGNAMNIQKEQSNKTQLIYFKNNQKYYLPPQIHEALKQIQTINSEVTFPTINLEVPENKLIDYFMRQLFNV